MNYWPHIIGAGVLTFAIRLSMIVFSGRLILPDSFQRALAYVPVAVLSAIIFPEMLLPGGQLDISFGNLRLLAGLVAIVVARLTGNVLWTVVFGLGTLWILQAIM